MPTTPQMSLFGPPELAKKIRQAVEQLLSSYMQPSARELLEHLEKEFGWTVRWDLRDILRSMANNRSLTHSVREYLRSVVEGGDLEQALRGEGAPKKEVSSTIDALVRQSKAYRSSKAFSEIVDFMARFRDYAPFNNMLVRVQNPSCSFYATAKDWRERFERTLKEDARPMLILAPMHPVMLVYDLDQTEGKPVPEELLKFARFEGDYEPKWLDRMLGNAAGHRIKIGFKTLSSTQAGFATLARETGQWKMRIAVHDELDGPSRLGVLCHELAHILLGHLGTDEDLWWPSRSNLTRKTVEIEAEAATHIATTRLGLKGTSAEYVSRYLGDEELPLSVSVDLVAKVSGHLERMARERMPARRSREKRRRRRNR